MTETWVVNASPIITLAKVARLDLLLSENRVLIIPHAVAMEILQGPEQDPARLALESGWGNRYVEDAIEHDVLEWGLGAGESSVLSLALKENAVAVVDDRAARIACKSLGIRFIGTLGVVLRARRDERISSAVEVLRSLRQAGLYFDDEMIRIVLQKTVGETWEP